MNKKRTLEHKEILERLAYALSYGLWGIVLDRNIVDIKGIEDFFSEMKLWGTFLITTNRNLTVIKINERGLRNKCLYEKCGRVPEELLEKCLGECIINSVEELRLKLIEILKGIR